MNVIPEIRRQRHALLRKDRDPKVLYLGPDEYVGFWQETDETMPCFFHRNAVDGEKRVVFDGMEIIERVKPGIHVCEAPPASEVPAPRRCRFPNCDCYAGQAVVAGALIECRDVRPDHE